jgi:aminotransferase EvaB
VTAPPARVEEHAVEELGIPAAAPTRLAPDERAAALNAVDAVLTAGPLIGGPFVEEFETAFAAYLGVRHCVGVDNGSDALILAIQALGCSPGGVALVAPNDGGYAAAAAHAAGLRPVATDVDPGTGLMTLTEIEKAWQPGVAAVVVTHLHGLSCDVEPVVRWCRERGVTLVEDCAQATGARRGNALLGSFGDAAAFSFYPTKNLGAFGDAGAVVCARDDVADRVRRLRQYGWREPFRIEDARGRNARLDAVQAAVLAARLPFLDRNNAARRAVVARYREAARPQVILGPDDASFVAHHAVVLSDDRDGLRQFLGSRGVGTAVHYPHLIDEMPALQPGTAAATPHAAALRQRILSLPCFPTMTAHELETVCAALSAWSARRD